MHTAPLSSSSFYPNAQPFFGIVETTVQALCLVNAAKQGVIPRVLRRLNSTERDKMIVSGAVFVFNVEESGIRRWTDGRLFSPSRIDGNFLVYRELNGRNGSPRNPDRSESWISMSGDGGRDINPDLQRYPGRQCHPQVSFATAGEGGIKVGGLVKTTITVKIHGPDHHVISYYTPEDVQSGRFRPMSSRSDIMSLHLPVHIFKFSHFRFPPRVEIGRDGSSRIVCESEPQHVPSAELALDDTTSHPAASQTFISHDSSWSNLTPTSAAAHPAVSWNPGVVVSSSGVATERWPELAIQSEAQEAPWSSLAASSERQYEDERLDTSSQAVSCGSISVSYQTQRPLHPHSDLSPVSNPPDSQLQESKSFRSKREMFEEEWTDVYGYNRENKHIAEEDSPAGNIHDVQSPNSGALNLSHFAYYPSLASQNTST